MYSLYKWGPGVLPRKSLENLYSRMQEKPSTTFLGLILYIFIFINQFSLFFSSIL